MVIWIVKNIKNMTIVMPVVVILLRRLNQYSKSQIQTLRDREASFNPVLIPKKEKVWFMELYSTSKVVNKTIYAAHGLK